MRLAFGFIAMVCSSHVAPAGIIANVLAIMSAALSAHAIRLFPVVSTAGGGGAHSRACWSFAAPAAKVARGELWWIGLIEQGSMRMGKHEAIEAAQPAMLQELLVQAGEEAGTAGSRSIGWTTPDVAAGRISAASIIVPE